MEDKIANFFHCKADNVGDQMCGPAQYLWPSSSYNIPFNAKGKEPIEKAIIGGGQVLSQSGLQLASLLDQSRSARVIGWGVGLPVYGTRDSMVRDVLEGFTLFGTRNYDWHGQLPFVPCASCLSSLFDNAQAPSRELVFYLHRKKTAPSGIPHDASVMINSMGSPAAAVAFIGSGETVVTSSYHGVYWAQLLGRRVVCVPYGGKFATFQHHPTVAEPDQWQSALREAKQTVPLLEEYRYLNHSFAKISAERWYG